MKKWSHESGLVSHIFYKPHPRWPKSLASFLPKPLQFLSVKIYFFQHIGTINFKSLWDIEVIMDKSPTDISLATVTSPNEYQTSTFVQDQRHISPKDSHSCGLPKTSSSLNEPSNAMSLLTFPREIRDEKYIFSQGWKILTYPVLDPLSSEQILAYAAHFRPPTA